MNRDDDPQLWDLLGKSAARPVSPFFARNVLREIRKEQPRRPSFVWLRWLVPAAGVAAVLVAGALTLHHPAVRDSANTTVVAKADLDDDVAADIDDLVSSDDDDSDDTSAIR